MLKKDLIWISVDVEERRDTVSTVLMNYNISVEESLDSILTSFMLSLLLLFLTCMRL